MGLILGPGLLYGYYIRWCGLVVNILDRLLEVVGSNPGRTFFSAKKVSAFLYINNIAK